MNFLYKNILQRASVSGLLLSCVLPIAGMVDRNNNALSDAWELKYNNLVLFTAANATHSPTADPDQDGWTNAQECLAGTNPFSASGVTGKTAVKITPALQQNSFELAWPVIVGKVYRVQTSSDMTFWANVGPLMTAGTNDRQLFMGIQTTNTATDSAAPRLFWRVKVLDQDTDEDGLSNADELILKLDPNQSRSFLDIPDQNLAEYHTTELVQNGISGILLDIDPDNDGSLNLQELQDNTDPKNPDTDGDTLLDSQDAVPTDIEINWLKTPALTYTWQAHVTEISPLHKPIAINRDGQILFRDGRLTGMQISDQKNLWDSASQTWVTLELNGQQNINIGTNEWEMSWSYNGKTVNVAANQTQFDLIEPVIEFIDINDNGVIFGLSKGDHYGRIDPLIPGMVWKRSGTSKTQYAPPNYFFPQYPFPAGEISSVVHNNYYQNALEPRKTFGGIANDGTINALCSHAPVGFNIWMNYASSGNTYCMTTVRDLDQEIDENMTFPGAILDQNRSLCVERRALNAGAYQSKIWLKEGTAISELSFMTNQVVEVAEMSEAINKKQDNSSRLWITSGDACLLEKRIGGTGTARWHKPASMKLGAHRLNAQGLAITEGDPDGQIPKNPTLWRNGKYIDLNTLITKPAGSNLQIIKAIDLSTNGLILVVATENGVTKTGILTPVAP